MAKVEIIGNQLVLREDVNNGDQSASITAPSSLTSSIDFVLPSTGGTIATQEYVTTNAGGVTATVAKNTAGQSSVTTTLANVTNCSVTLEASKTYRITLKVRAGTNHTATNAKYQLTVSTGALASESRGVGVFGLTQNNGAPSGATDSKPFYILTDSPLRVDGHTYAYYMIDGSVIVTNGAASSVIDLQFGQYASQAAAEDIFTAYLIAEKLD